MSDQVTKFSEAFANVSMGMYAGKPCRVCGKAVGREDLDGMVFAGYSKGNESCAAHGDCWDRDAPKSGWALPDDEPGSADSAPQ